MKGKANKPEDQIKKLSKLEGNKTCADCPEKVPGYVDLTHNVFICTKCSGIHRESQFKVKGVSMSIFTQEDVDALAEMGNEKFNGIYLANLNPRDFSLPNGNDLPKLKEFIRHKYIDKKWHRDGHGRSFDLHSTNVNTNSHMEQTEGTSGGPQRLSIKLNRPNVAPINRRASTGSVDFVKKASTTDLVNEMDLLSVSDQQPSFDPFAAPPAKQTTSDPFATTAASSSFDPFGSNVATQVQTAFDPFAQGSSSVPSQSFDPFTAQPVAQSNTKFDPFGSAAPAQHTVPSAQSFDPFSNSAAASTVSFDPFGPAAAKTVSSTPFDPFSVPAVSTVDQGSNSNLGNFGGNNSFNAFPVPAPAASQSSASMPFIKLNPPTALAPAASTQPQEIAAPKKDFGAFDDLVTVAAPIPETHPASANPFDSHFAAHTSPSTGNQQAHHAPVTNPAQAPSQYQPYGVNPPQMYPQSGVSYNQYGQPQYSHAYPQSYPAPQYQQYSAGPNPTHPQQPQHVGMPYPAQSPNPTPVVTLVQAQAPQAPANDPFAAMSSLAWNAVGGTAPAPSTTKQQTSLPHQGQSMHQPQLPQYQVPPQHQTQLPQYHVPPQHQTQPQGQYYSAPQQQPLVTPQPPPATQSVNPFDLF